MTRVELIRLLELLDAGITPTVELYILNEPILDDEGDISVDIYRGRIHEDVSVEIAEIFYPKIKRILVQREYTLEKYNPEQNPDRNVIWQYPTSEVPFFNKILNEFQTAEETYYDEDDLPYSEIWAVWFKLKIQRSIFYILKKITPSKVLSTGGVLAMIFKGDSFKSLKEDVLTIDGTFDVLACNNTLIFENKQKFEKALLYEEIKQEIAKEALEEIYHIDIIENFDDFQQMLIDDKHSINKLTKLKAKRYFREKTFEDYRRIIDRYNINIELDEAEEKFIITNKAQAKLLVKVLNDDYLMSELTEIKYSAHSKETI